MFNFITCQIYIHFAHHSKHFPENMDRLVRLRLRLRLRLWLWLRLNTIADTNKLLKWFVDTNTNTITITITKFKYLQPLLRLKFKWDDKNVFRLENEHFVNDFVNVFVKFKYLQLLLRLKFRWDDTNVFRLGNFVNDFANDFVNNFVNKPLKPLGDEIVKRLSIKMRIWPLLRLKFKSKLPKNEFWQVVGSGGGGAP